MPAVIQAPLPASREPKEWVRIDPRTGDASCNHGVKWRFPPEVRKELIRRYDERKARRKMVDDFLWLLGRQQEAHRR